MERIVNSNANDNMNSMLVESYELKCNKTTRSGNTAANGNEYTVPPTTDGYVP